VPPRVRTSAGTGAPTSPGPATNGRRRGPVLGDELYLWLLVGLELAVTVHLRTRFRSAHGG
jgi:hypothetical protein